MTPRTYWTTWLCILPLVLTALYFVIRWAVAAGLADFFNSAHE